MFKVFAYTSFALIAFALNSILCRLALRGGEADGTGFTFVRLMAGAVMLGVIFIGRNTSRSEVAVEPFNAGSGMLPASQNLSLSSDKHISDETGTLATARVSVFGSWRSAWYLFAYAACFSFAYLGLTAAAGALILFGSVQITMIGAGLVAGERPSAVEWLGIAAAFGGLVYLVLPGLDAPPIFSSLLMSAAGMAWAGYTIRGRGSADPLADTTGNFLRTLPFACILAVIYLPNISLTARGAFLAVLSGAVASGVGYAAWYAALRFHTSTRAAVLQLSVPVIAATLGVMFLSETADLRLVIAAILTLGGIAIAIAGRK